jgi:hypothetical protein
MKLGVRFLAIVVTIAMSLIASGYALKFLFKAEPLVGQVDNFPSANGQWVATLEEVDNGLGFGQGMLYDEVHIHHPDERIADHGDDDKSAIFYANSMGKSGKRPQIKWIDSTHLLITYSPATIDGGTPGKALKEFHGILIDYDTGSLK